MTDHLAVKSAQDAQVLELGPPVGKGGDGYFPARLLGGPDTPAAKVEVYEYNYHAIPLFFEDLAKHWRGWSDSKSWNSLEGHLGFEATTDRLGHIYLRVTLRAVEIAADWKVQTTLLIEAGQLDRLAREAKEVFGAAPVV